MQFLSTSENYQAIAHRVTFNYISVIGFDSKKFYKSLLSLTSRSVKGLTEITEHYMYYAIGNS